MKHFFTTLLCFFALSLSAQYTLTVEASTPAVAAGTTYRFYVDLTDASDRMSAIFGNIESPLEINTPAGAFNSSFNASWSASGINPAFLGFFPEMADDTYATIGLDGPAVSPQADPSLVEDAEQPITPFFTTNGATSLFSNTLTGSSYYVLNTAANGLPDANMRVLVLQVTTTGAISGTLNYQVFPLGVGADQVQISMPFDGVGTFGGLTDIDGCTDATACNYNVNATIDDDSCLYPNLGEDCNGDCLADYDGDGVCDNLSFPLEVEAYQVHSTSEGIALLNGKTTYRLYITNLGATDFVSSIYGYNEAPLEISVPEGVYNSGFNASWSASGISPVFVGVFPEMAYDSYATIGLSQSAATSGILGAADPSIVEDPLQQITPLFLIDGATGVSVSSAIGVTYYIINGNPVGLPDATGRVLIMQITTTGSISGKINVQIFPNGVGVDFLTYTYAFDGVGLHEADGDCAGNVFDECGVCGGDGFPEGACDCDGNVLDECGVCGGNAICLVCGDGTVWSFELGQCIVSYPSDSNFDGCVDLNDLMDLLSSYGLCLDPE